jgi:hypothetical protein
VVCGIPGGSVTGAGGIGPFPRIYGTLGSIAEQTRADKALESRGAAGCDQALRRGSARHGDLLAGVARRYIGDRGMVMIGARRRYLFAA